MDHRRPMRNTGDQPTAEPRRARPAIAVVGVVLAASMQTACQPENHDFQVTNDTGQVVTLFTIANPGRDNPGIPIPAGSGTPIHFSSGQGCSTTMKLTAHTSAGTTYSFGQPVCPKGNWTITATSPTSQSSP
jgi:hypothetical protein